MVVRVGDEKHTGRAHGYRRGRGEHGRGAVARDRRDRSVRRDLAYAVVAAVRDVYVAGGVERETRWQVQIGRGSWSAVTTVRSSAAPREGDDVAAVVDPPDAVIVRVGDKETAIARYRDPDRRRSEEHTSELQHRYDPE